MNRTLSFQTPHGTLHGQLILPGVARGVVLLAHAHHAPVDEVIATHLVDRGFAFLSMDLLSAQEAQFVDAPQNVPRLTQRLIDLLNFAQRDGDLLDLPIAMLAAGDASPAAVRAAAQRDLQIHALACHGGLIDRAGRQALEILGAPLLMICDADDDMAPLSYQRAAVHLHGTHKLQVLGAAETAVEAAADWFAFYLREATQPAGIPAP